MASEAASPQREPTPSAFPSSLPQKRSLEDDHSPAVSSPLNPEPKIQKSQVQIDDSGRAILRFQSAEKRQIEAFEAEARDDKTLALYIKSADCRRLCSQTEWGMVMQAQMEKL